MKLPYVPVLVLYYVEWALKTRHFHVENINPNYVTHLTYAFANINENGEVVYGNIYTALEHTFSCSSSSKCQRFPEDLPAEENQLPIEVSFGCDLEESREIGYRIRDTTKKIVGDQLRGNLGKMFEFKLKNRHVKTCMAIGGWVWSTQFPNIIADKRKQTTFVKSVLTMLIDCGMDGVELDWEFPGTGGAYGSGNPDVDGPGYVSLIKELKEEIETRAKAGTCPRFFISVAAPCTNYVMSHFPIAELAPYVDHFNLMCYDISGQWSSTSWHHAPLFGTQTYKDSADNAVSFFLAKGVPREKIILGIPNYGRTFGNTDGVGSKFTGTGKNTNGKGFEDGVACFSELPAGSETEFTYHEEIGTSTTYLRKTKTLISHESVESVKQKANYIIKNGLGGGMMWESSQDKKIGNEMQLCKTLGETLWSGTIQNFKDAIPKNCIKYPNSRFTNIRAYSNSKE